MNITSKSRYAIKIMMDLALHSGEPHSHRRDIVRRQGIPSDYLDQIMQRLRRGELVESVRGRGGGYRLARPADQISVWDIFYAVEDILYPVECVDHAHDCHFETSCVSHDAWSIIFGDLRRSLMERKLADLVSGGAEWHQMCPAAGVRNCNAGVNRAIRPS